MLMDVRYSDKYGLGSVMGFTVTLLLIVHLYWRINTLFLN